jgi:hypothetical protein
MPSAPVEGAQQEPNMFKLTSLAVAVTVAASALVSTAPAASARDRVIVIEESGRPQHAREHRRDRHHARDYRAMRRAEARRAEARHQRRLERRHERRHDRYDRSHRSPTVVLQVR